jgi:hypothetical protein
MLLNNPPTWRGGVASTYLRIRLGYFDTID